MITFPKIRNQINNQPFFYKSKENLRCIVIVLESLKRNLITIIKSNLIRIKLYIAISKTFK